MEQLRRFPEVDRAELIRYVTLTPADEAFVRQFRGQGKVLGAAVQLCTLPWLGFVPDDVPPELPTAGTGPAWRRDAALNRGHAGGRERHERADASVLVAEVVGLLNEAECYSRSYFRLSRMRRWLRPRYTSGHDRPRDEEGEPP